MAPWTWKQTTGDECNDYDKVYGNGWTKGVMITWQADGIIDTPLKAGPSDLEGRWRQNLLNV